MKYIKKSILWTVVIVLFIYLAGSSVAFAFGLGLAYQAKNDAAALKTQLQEGNQDLALETFFSLEKKISTANFLNRFSFWMRAIPVINKDYAFYSEMLGAGGNILKAGTDSIKELSQDNVSLQISLETINFKDALSVYLKHHDQIIDSFDNLKDALKLADQIHLGLLPGGSQQQAKDIIEQLNGLIASVEQFEPFFEHIPFILGDTEPHDMLVLLQNPDELRPTGGFIGTIGRVTLNAGKIEQLQTDDVYKIDGQVLGREKDIAPEPISRFTEVEYWYLRDANWSPDFEEAAVDIKNLYEYESGEEGIDTLVAITPFLIEQLLDITGPIIVASIEFNASNLVDAIQFRVEQQFWQIGLSNEERKSIINDLTQALQERVFTLNVEQISKFLQVVKVALDQREILVYTSNPKLQALIVQRKYAGKVFDIGSDYLYIVDANLGALKTDRVMVRNRNYTLTQGEDGAWIARLELEYINNGFFDYRTTRYRTYTRVYVPIGSTLISAEGLMLTDRSTVHGQVEVYSEFNKTVFAGFISIEPEETGSIVYTYELPRWLSDQFARKGTYELFFQKQPGVANQTLNADIDLLKPVNVFSPSTTAYTAIDESHLKFTEPIFGDNFYRLEFEPLS